MNTKIATEQTNVINTPLPTSRPSVRTSERKRPIVSWLSGGVANVATIHATDVAAIVHSSFCQKRSGVAEMCGQTTWKKTAQRKETAIATISVHAFMRIQNHLRRNTSPVPAPTCTIRSKPDFALSRSGARAHPKTIKTTDAARATRISSRSPASFRTKRFQTSLVT